MKIKEEKIISNENKTLERILCAAINYKGIIIAGHRHSDCYKVLEMMRKTIHEVIDDSMIFVTLDLDDGLPGRDKQGFLTSHNRYVNRKEAWEIAKANDQIIYGKDSSDEYLISENLY
jgi:hypothetical protein